MKMPGEQLLMKLVDTLASGLGALTRSWLTKRDARAKAIADADSKRIIRLAQEKLRADIKEVRAGKRQIGDDYNLLPPPEQQDEKAEIQRIIVNYVPRFPVEGYTFQQTVDIERQINLDQISAIVIEEAAEDKDGTADDKPIDPDWFVQWRNRAQDISNEQMQRLWAKVLKEEVKVSGTFSIHAMDFLARMSRDDANLVATLGNFAVESEGVFRGAAEILDKSGLTLKKLLYLESIGILNGVIAKFDGLSLTQKVSKKIQNSLGVSFSCNSRVVLAYEPNLLDLKEVELPAYAISSLGQELLKLADCTAPDEYLVAIGNHFKGHFRHVAIGRFGLLNADGSRSVVDVKPL